MTGPEISAIPKEARAYQGQSAGVVSRVVANTIDAAVVGAIVGALYLGFVSVTFLLDPLSFIWPDAHLLASLTATLAMATFYLFVCWWLLGRTYGDHVMGLRVVGRRGRRLGPLRSLMRAGFCVFFPIGLFWCVISPERRSVQDVTLWTRVVYDWMPRPGASQRKTLLGDAKMAMGPAESGELPPAGGSPSASEMPDVVRATESDAPLRRHRWSRDADSHD